LKILRNFRHIEVQPPFVLAYRPAGDGERKDHREQMQRRMHAHQAVAPIPVDGQIHALTQTQTMNFCRRYVDDCRLATIRMNDG
jgi:hypothetical protein